MTIIELLIAMLSASILAITAGIILVFCFRTLRANGDAVGLQRDVDITTRTLYRAIRTTRRTEVSAPAAGASGAQLTINNRSFFRATAAHVADVNGAYLIYDPNLTVAGDEQVMVDGSVQSFVFRNNTYSIGIAFTLQEENDTISVDTDIHMRNEI
ncbi:MAG: hypothetical protein HN919_22300 [Verrucomicrobia bacterium]|nr:hypothetical protein [Verrucomicrobiota bacterium]MBT7069044.1 hypothetical protein [Verrucomicrobiota bacterium]MBT7702221.1 hypothetical protein [Verrucomicrobiota bacterium]